MNKTTSHINDLDSFEGCEPPEAKPDYSGLDIEIATEMHKQDLEDLEDLEDSEDEPSFWVDPDTNQATDTDPNLDVCQFDQDDSIMASAARWFMAALTVTVLGIVATALGFA